MCIHRVLVPLLLICASARPLAADSYDETEQRLKTAGIEAPLRARIRDAIDRGVAYLLERQARNGSVHGHVGTTALAALALRHAATPQATEAARRAARWLRGTNRRTARDSTYEAGLTCMLLQALDAEGRDLAFLREIHTRLAKGPRSDQGLWGYQSSGGSGPPNLSTAQFGALGLWAAERGGAARAPRTWALHLDALLRDQGEDGSWPYYPEGYAGDVAGDFAGYPTATCMGLANLLLAQQAMGEALAADPARDARVRLARGAGRAALRRHAPWILTAPEAQFAGALGRYPLYRIYALEKAAIFLSTESLGGLPWYREGALWLLRLQRPDGSWPFVPPAGGARAASDGRDPWGTAFALLFLLRASASYHPVTPRPIARPPAITPRESDARRPGAPAKAAPPLDLAREALSKLEAACRGRRLTALRPLDDALRLTARIHRQSRRADGGFASAGHETWARRAEDVVLAVTTRFDTATPRARPLWQALALEALDVLGGLHPRVGMRLMKRVDERAEAAGFRVAYPPAWYAAAMDALARLDPPGLVAWLHGHALSAAPGHHARTSAALTTLGGLADDMRGPVRYATAHAVFATLGPLLREHTWRPARRDLVVDAYMLVLRLAREGGAEDLPVPTTFAEPAYADRLLAWWDAHDAPDNPVWQP